MSTSYLPNSVMLITGAASGIGRELALQGAKRGAAVIGVDINFSELEETQALVRKEGNEIEIHQLDVADKAAVFAFADKIIPTLAGRRLVLVNNAGVGLFSGSFEHTELEDFEWLLNVNLWGTIYPCKAFYPYFIRQNEGHIVNLSSVFGLAGAANQSAYCTSKFAVRGFTETLRMELAGTNIRTTVVHPGGIKTNIVRASLPKGPIATEAMHCKSVRQFERAAPTTAEKAARLILEAIEKKKQRLVIGPDGKALDFISRLLPVRYTKILKGQIAKTFTDPYQERKRGKR
ncbi:SDR family NAD(P)-dependent oxidoreductase [Nafulsella turpanensis]|uniref:SDR family NAD(P)-dependent oxidoreductase n=1 Tax=Nafulsella turpanensis TaxID=1265690 RepID=UPI0003486E68|nr:SDR family oxidoreductase [Nafulsella turpanensis]